jgi:Flp pilus assembly pilin Flp
MIDRATRWVLAHFWGEEGQAAAEYGVLLALILVVSIALIAILGGQIADAFQAITDAL